MINSKAAGEKSAAFLLRKPWERYSNQPLSRRKEVFEELLGHFEHTQRQHKQNVIAAWKKGLRL